MDYRVVAKGSDFLLNIIFPSFWILAHGHKNLHGKYKQ